jgi:hypothetical protein
MIWCPVRLSARNRYVAFDDATITTLSPIRHLNRLHAPLIVAHGSCETPEFQRQNREFAAAVEAAGKKARLLVGEHYNHFELPETLGNPYGLPGAGRARADGLNGRSRTVTRIQSKEKSLSQSPEFPTIGWSYRLWGRPGLGSASERARGGWKVKAIATAPRPMPNEPI